MVTGRQISASGKQNNSTRSALVPLGSCSKYITKLSAALDLIKWKICTTLSGGSPQPNNKGQNNTTTTLGQRTKQLQQPLDKGQNNTSLIHSPHISISIFNCNGKLMEIL